MAWSGSDVKQFTPSTLLHGAVARDRYVVVGDKDTGTFAVFDASTSTARQFTGLGRRCYQMSTSADNQDVWHAGEVSGYVRLSKINPASGTVEYWTGPAARTTTTPYSDPIFGCVDAGDLVWVWMMDTSPKWSLQVFDTSTELFSAVDSLADGPDKRPFAAVHANVLYWANTKKRWNATTAASLSPLANETPSTRAIGPLVDADGCMWWLSDYFQGWDLAANAWKVAPTEYSEYVPVSGALPARLGTNIFAATSGHNMFVYSIPLGTKTTAGLPTSRIGRHTVYKVGSKLVIPSTAPSTW